jgi:hypothetical protein
MKGEVPLATGLAEAIKAFAKTPIRGGKSESLGDAHINFLFKGSI